MEVKTVLVFLAEIKKRSLSTINRELLCEWFTTLAEWETFLGQELVKSERTYNTVYKTIRAMPAVKTKADAEILSRDTDQWSVWQEYKRIYEDIEKMMNILKRVQDLYEREYSQTAFEQQRFER